jgi:chaperonin GroEL (HSP60 family)
VNDVRTGNDIGVAIANVMRHLSDVEIHVKNNALKSGRRPVIHSQLQVLFNLKFQSALESSVYETILRHALAAEKMGPGAFIEFIQMLLENFRQSNCMQQPFICHDMSEILRDIRHPTTQDVETIVDKFMVGCNVRTASMLKQAVKLAGFGGRIVVEKTAASVSSVELVRGYTFKARPCFDVTARLEHPRIFCIDGYVESVSEVHHLFEAVSAAKETCVIFVRGLSDDVKHTVKVNYDRGSLKLIPVIVQYDLEGMNMLNDISVVAGCDLVSSTKGDLISSIKFEAGPRIDDVMVYPTKVVITNSKTGKSVNAQVSMLQQKRSESDVDDVIHLLDDRIRALSPNHVVIRLLDDKDFVTNSQAIDYALRAIRSAVDYGIIDGRLTTTVMAAKIHSARCFLTLSALGCIVN